MAVTWKRVSGTDASTYPVDVWKPAAGKKVRVADLFLSINNKSTGTVNIRIKIRNGGTLDTLHQIGCQSNEKKDWSHTFAREPLETDNAATPTPDVQIEVDVREDDHRGDQVVVEGQRAEGGERRNSRARQRGQS